MPNGVHVGIKKLLDQERLKEQDVCVVFISCYQGEQPFDGIMHAVKFRLFYPSIPVIFFSFYTKGQLHSKDTFGVLALEGTEFIQLPCRKEKLVQAAKKYDGGSLDIGAAKWTSFSTKACKALLKQHLAELKHGNKFDLGNRVLNPLRIACITYRDQANKPLIKAKISVLKEYKELPKIAELIKLANVCKNADDDFLTATKNFADLLEEMANWDKAINKDNIHNLVTKIDRLNNTFEQVKDF